MGKNKPCLVCGKMHRSTWFGDRLHEHCRDKISNINDSIIRKSKDIIRDIENNEDSYLELYERLYEDDNVNR